MNTSTSTMKSGWLVCLLIIGSITICKAHSYPAESQALIYSPSPADSDTLLLPSHSKYSAALTGLLETFRKEGIDINELYQDNRFDIYEEIGDRFRNSAERKSLNLEEYKNILGFEDKQKRGTDFIRRHDDQLQKAQEEYGIPKYIIAAILGIESDYGQNIGSYNPFNTYVSMYAVDYRADFAEAQLLELLQFTQRHNIDIFELKSSYAGAMSFAQFIPYSLNKWFIGDDIFDMNNNIMSIANYLAYFQERTNNLRTSVLRYNPSGLYADAVLDLADALQEGIDSIPQKSAGL